MAKRLSVSAILVLAFTILTACTGSKSESSLKFEDPWIRAVQGINQMADGGAGENSPMDSGPTTGAFLTIANNTDQEDRLIRVESDVAAAIEIHETVMVNDVMTMRPVESVEVRANGKVELQPGGLHIMLIGLKRDIKPDETISLNMIFEKAGSISVEFLVKNP